MNSYLRRAISTLVVTAALTGGIAVGTSPAFALVPNVSCGTVTDEDSAAASGLNQVLTGSLQNVMNAYRLSCARAIVNTVRARGLPDRAAVIAVTTAIVESNLENNPNVLDHSSVGLFQQLDSWGSTANRLNPTWSTNAFIDEMLRIYPDSWQTQQIGVVCQGVQRSAYPDRYQPQSSDAQKIVDAITTTAPVSAPAAVAATAGQSLYNPDTKTAEVFAVGADGVMSHSYSTNGGAWSAWATLGTNFQFAGKPVAVYNPVSKVTEVFAIGTDGVMLHNYIVNGGVWSGWSTLNTTYKFAGSPAAVYNSASNAIELFGIGTDGVMSHMYNIDGGDWSGWTTMGSFNFKGSPNAVYNADTKTAEVFAVGTDGVMSHSYSTSGINGGTWSPWATLGTNYQFTGSPAITYNPVNKVTEVFGLGTDGVMSHDYITNGGTWSGWSTLNPGYKFTGSPAAVYNPSSNAVELFGIGTDGVMNHMYNINAGAWSGWSTLGSFKFAGTPSAVYESGTSTAEVFGTGTDGAISHAYSTNGGAWSDWNTLGTWAFQTS